MKYQGSCHCQNVRFEVETDLKEAMSCNCSICARRGHLLAFTPKSAFKLLTDEKSLSDYQWGKKSIHFTFCSKCGCAPFGRGVTPDGEMMAINIRCLENADWASVPVTQFDGKHLL